MDGLLGGVPGRDLDAATWVAIEALYDRVWPGLSSRLRTAESLGARWADCTTPFVWFEGGRAVSTVGVLAHPVILAGEDAVLAGFHAVATDPGHRRRGHCGRLLAAAVAWAEERYALAELCTASPAVFRPAGFRELVVHRFLIQALEVGGGPRPLRRLDLADPEDRALVRRRLDARVPVSRRFATREPGWLTLIDAALAGVTARWFYEAREVEAVVVAERDERGWVLHDLIGPALPPLEAILRSLPDPAGEVRLSFAPDLVAPDARPEPFPEQGFMVRGAWPTLPPIGMPPLWEH